MKGQKSTILFILLGIFLFNILNGLLSFLKGNTETLSFVDVKEESLRQRFSDVHFITPGNDFGGAILWLTSKTLSTPITLTFGGNSSLARTCYKQLRGIYYNDARGQRLRPLDQDTLKLLSGYTNKLYMNGGFYTACTGNTSDSTYSIFGLIIYTGNLVNTGYLVAGTTLNRTGNIYYTGGGGFTNNLQYFNNVTPLGFFWDSAGGIGFIGGQLTGNGGILSNDLNAGTKTINTSFALTGSNNDTIISKGNGRALVNNLTSGSGAQAAQNVAWNLLVQGKIGIATQLNNNSGTAGTKVIQGNLDKRSIVLNANDLNSAILLNTAKKNASTLCRGVTYNKPLTTNAPILCYKNTNLSIDLTQTSDYANKTILVQSGNVTLNGTMGGSSPALDLFIDKGLLYLPNTLTQKTSFNSQGFPTKAGDTPVTSGMFLKGTFIVNGLLVGGTPGAESDFQHKLHLQGKITTLNTFDTPSVGRIAQVTTLLQAGIYTPYILLSSIFTRYCGLDGVASDSTACIDTSSTALISITPFVVLNGDYRSNLLSK